MHKASGSFVAGTYLEHDNINWSLTVHCCRRAENSLRPHLAVPSSSRLWKAGVHQIMLLDDGARSNARSKQAINPLSGQSTPAQAVTNVGIRSPAKNVLAVIRFVIFASIDGAKVRNAIISPQLPFRL